MALSNGGRGGGDGDISWLDADSIRFEIHILCWKITYNYSHIFIMHPGASKFPPKCQFILPNIHMLRSYENHIWSSLALMGQSGTQLKS